MNLCCSCIHKDICEWDISAYGKDYSFGMENCSDYRLENEERCQGEWLTHRIAFHLTCPFCGCNVRALKDKVFEGEFNYNFCPNCGADMCGGKLHEC
ncbi:MAG: hypothetical protein J6S67_02825 [Methanobrevibacter sp.]|nr:hypothetical protein [Methanobrevibacter sp.]